MNQKLSKNTVCGILTELCICHRLASHILHSSASHDQFYRWRKRRSKVIGGGSKRSKSKLPTSSFCFFHDSCLSDLAIMLLWTSQRPNFSAQQIQTSQLLTYLCHISKYLLRGAHLSYLKVDNILHYVTITSLLAVFTFSDSAIVFMENKFVVLLCGRYIVTEILEPDRIFNISGHNWL